MKWEHQPRAISMLREAFKTYRKVMLQLPTGGGKTRIAGDIINMAISKGKKVMFIVDRNTLINQASQAFDELSIPHGIVQADHWRYRPWENVQICSVHTLNKRGRHPDADFVIVDEAHTHHKFITELMEKWSLVKFLGLSATPFTNGLGKYWEHMVIAATTSELQEKGTLLPPIVYAPPTIDTDKIKVVSGEYQQKSLYNAVNTKEITADIVDTYLKHGEDRKAICFPVNVAHSKTLMNEFNLAGVPTQHIDSHTSPEDRDLYFDKLNKGELQILCSVGVLQKGFDEKSVSCVILAKATKSLIQYIQMVGRGARSFEGQKDYIILDHGSNVERLGWPDDPLPDFLCDGEKTETQKQKEREKEQTEKELKPKVCPQCHRGVEANIFTCPSCGYIFTRTAEVEVKDGELKELKRVKPAVKKEWYRMLLFVARQRGYKDNWASWKFKDKFSHFPHEKHGLTPIEPNEDVRNYVKYCDIKAAKSRSKKLTSKVATREQFEKFREDIKRIFGDEKRRN